MERRRLTLTAGAVLAPVIAGCGLLAATATPFDTAQAAGPVATAAGTASPLLGPRAARPAVAMPDRPNVVMITTDDAAVTDLAYLPHVRHLLADRGTTLGDAIAPTPLCVPARASLLTGQYATNHGARSISGPHGGAKALREQETLPVWLHRAGYRTWFTGKYLNGYGDRPATRRHVPPGWDEWRALTAGSTYNYARPVLNVNGRLRHYDTYSTDLIRQQSLAMLRARPRSHRPFFLWVNYVAPHFGGPRHRDDPARRFGTTAAELRVPSPAPADRGTFARLRLPDVPSMFEADVSDKPPASPAHHRYGPDGRRAARLLFQRRVEALQDVDRSVAATVRQLARMHQLRHTLVIFSSDNGYAVGQHHYVGKLFGYDDQLRVPMILRGPGVPRGNVVGTTVTNPDIATTIVRLARARPRVPQDGVNVLPWLHGPTRVRVVPIAAWPVGDGAAAPKYVGVRVGAWTYLRYRNGDEELYDRTVDPYELTNVAADPAYADRLDELRGLTARYRDCAGATCPKAFHEPAPTVVGTGA